MMTDFAVIGKRTPAKGYKDIITGHAKYTTDFYSTDMLTGGLLYTQHPCACVLKIDTTKARQIPGVMAVLTGEDVPGENSYDLYDTDQPLLIETGSCSRYQGDALVAVAAVDEPTMQAALDAIEVKYEPLKGIFDVMEAVKPNAQRVWPDRGNIYAHHSAEQGDVDAGFTAADIIIENTYQTQLMEQAFLEPEGAVAKYDENGVIVVYAGCQAPHRDRRQIARSLGMPESQVRVIVPYVGGAFGGKDETHVQIHAALLTQATCKPVRMIRSREESIQTHVKRHPITVKHKLGATKDGKLTAIKVEGYADGGPYANMTSQVMDVFTIHASGPYYIPNSRIDAYAVLTNNPTGGAMRGFGMPQAQFASERQMDELARILDMDPVDIRMINGVQTGQKKATGVTVLDGSGMRNTLQEAVKISGYDTRDEISRKPAPHLRRGWGVASMMQGYLLGPKVVDTAHIGLEMHLDGSVTLRCGVVEYGQGSHTVLAQIAAESLGILLSDVHVIRPDTDKTLEAGSACAARVTHVCGHAVIRAAEPIRESLLKTAKELADAPSELLELKNGQLKIAGRQSDYSIADLAKTARANSRVLANTGYFSAEYPEGIFDEAVYGNPCAFYTYASKIAQVVVDIETGELIVEKLVLVQDAGRILNPDGAQGQAEGGASMGFGYSVMEELIVEEGRTKNNSLESYLIPTVKDVPEIVTKFLDTESDYGPYGGRAVSEGPVVPTAPAIANAVRDAVGISLQRIPLTAERILTAIQANREPD